MFWSCLVYFSSLKSLYYSKCMSVCVSLYCIQHVNRKTQKYQCFSPGTGNSSVLLPAACRVLAKQTVLHWWTTYVQRNARPRLEGREGRREAAPPSGHNRCTQLCQHVMLRFTERSRGGKNSISLKVCQLWRMSNINENVSPKQNSALGLSFVASLTWRWTDVTSVSFPAQQSGW